MGLANLQDTKRAILLTLKSSGSATIEELARRLRITREGIRLQLRELQKEGWVGRTTDNPGKRLGRPVSRFNLTLAGENLFPKAYDDLAVGIFDAIADKFGPKGTTAVLAAMADARVRQLEPLVKGKSIEDRLKILRGVYRKDDPFVTIDCSEGLSLIESNCPFLNVASRKPQLCSVTVSVLSRLLGRQVVRTERFQDGHGRCVFRVLADQPVPPQQPFRAEPANLEAARL